MNYLLFYLLLSYLLNYLLVNSALKIISNEKLRKEYGLPEREEIPNEDLIFNANVLIAFSPIVLPIIFIILIYEIITKGE